MNLGFTGTQIGLSPAQRHELTDRLDWLAERGNWFHHGDCIGADAQARDIAASLQWLIHQHPPLDERKRAFTAADAVSEPKGFLARNRDIVKASELMIACPAQAKEILRSGTWATIRETLRQRKPLIVILPDGGIRRFDQGEEIKL